MAALEGSAPMAPDMLDIRDEFDALEARFRLYCAAAENLAVSGGRNDRVLDTLHCGRLDLLHHTVEFRALLEAFMKGDDAADRADAMALGGNE